MSLNPVRLRRQQLRNYYNVSYNSVPIGQVCPLELSRNGRTLWVSVPKVGKDLQHETRAAAVDRLVELYLTRCAERSAGS